MATALVPKQSSNTSQIIYSAQWSSAYAAWHVFDQNASTEWAASGGLTNYIGWDFLSATKIAYALYNPGGASYMNGCELQCSDDKSTWITVSNKYNPTYAKDNIYYCLDPNPHRYWRFLISNSQSDNGNTREVQFYL